MKKSQHKRILLPAFLFFAIIPIAMFMAASFGAVQVSPADCFLLILNKLGIGPAPEVSPNVNYIFFQLRLPRVIMAVLGGAALAVCGCVFQSIFRNPICDPYILGISSGASLGAAVAFVLGWNVFVFGVTLSALVTALLTLALIFAITRGQHRSTYSLLLVGVALNFFLSAVITLIMVLHQESMHKIMFWTMGSLANAGWSEVMIVALGFITIIFALFYISKDLNLIQLGEETAKTLGVNTRRVTMLALALSSLLIAIVVSFCGVIGFVGLVIPHIVRLLVGSDCRRMMLYSLFAGAVFLLLADTIARTIALPSGLPVGSITAIVGGPYFIFLLLRGKREYL